MDGGFEAYVAARGAHLVRVARGLLRDPQQADDVVQDVLLRVHRQWDRVTAADVPDAYVRRMLVNACVSFWRRPARRELPVQVVADRATDDGSAARADRDLMLGLLRRLPAKQRAVLVLRHYEGLSDAEVAGLMGSSQQSVRSNAHRGLVSLRRMMTEVAR